MLRNLSLTKRSLTNIGRRNFLSFHITHTKKSFQWWGRCKTHWNCINLNKLVSVSNIIIAKSNKFKRASKSSQQIFALTVCSVFWNGHVFYNYVGKNQSCSTETKKIHLNKKGVKALMIHWKFARFHNIPERRLGVTQTLRFYAEPIGS